MKLIENIKDHPFVSTVYFIFFLLFPSIIEPWWGLFTDKPLIPTIIKKIGVMNMPDFPWYSYIPLPLTIAIVTYLIRNTRKTKPKKTESVATKESQPSSPLEIRFTENQLKYVCVDGETDNATYTWESVKFRVAIWNNSPQTINNVEARITGIKGCPYWLSNELPISLNCNGNERFSINPGMEEPVDIVIWQRDTRWEDEEMFAFCTNKKLQIPEGNFPISLTVSGEDVALVQKRFIINLKYRHEGDLKNKISMKEC